MNEEGLLNDEIKLGLMAEEFFKSPLGQWLQDYGDAEIREYQAKLQDLGVNWDDTQRYRMEIKARMLMFRWLRLAINTAEAADVRLNQYETED